MNTEPEQTLIAGERVTIRPIRSSDVGLETDFIRNLSIESKHYRFFGGVRELPAAEIVRFCTVDGHYTMAYVATVQRDGHEVEIGVCRYAPDTKTDVREMAVTIADEWQHKGLGQVLMQHLIATAKEHGVQELYSQDLADNPQMRDLAHEMGMSVRRDPADACQVIYSLPL
jgi:GNAT superfamily N-acetyltransferase